MKTFFKIIGILILILIIGIAVFISTFQPPKYSDFGVFDRLKAQTLELMQQYGAEQRPITGEFEKLAIHLSFPFNKLFGSDSIAIPIKSFESAKMAVGTISQFQVPPGSDYYRDFTLNIRPQYGVKAPVLHIDFMKPAPGTSGMGILDFFNVSKDAVSLDDFFGDRIGEIEKAAALVDKYQRTVEEGRGKLTKYLDPYKSPYRFELHEPKTGDESVRREYYETVAKAISIILPVYFSCLDKAGQDAAMAAEQEKKMKEMVGLVYKNDFAVSMGKKIFKEHFNRYWMDGFWNVRLEAGE